jgi:integrase
VRTGIVRTRDGKAYKPGSIRNYERTLRLYVLPALGPHRLADVRRVDAQDVVDDVLGKGLEPTTVQAAILPLRALHRRAVDRGDLAVNPTSGVDVPKVRRARDRIQIPSLDHARRLLDALEMRDRALCSTALFAGLRLGELQALRWEHVDLATGVIHVESGWDRVDREEIEPKTEDGRRKVPVAAELRDVLLEHRMTGAGEGYVFGRTPGEPFAPSSVYKRARRGRGAGAGSVSRTRHDGTGGSRRALTRWSRSSRITCGTRARAS